MLTVLLWIEAYRVDGEASNNSVTETERLVLLSRSVIFPRSGFGPGYGVNIVRDSTRKLDESVRHCVVGKSAKLSLGFCMLN